MIDLRTAPALRAVRVLAPAAIAATALVMALSPACSSTALPPPSGDFAAPTALAVAPARDRDLLFVASSGNDDLRAITICNAPTLPDGGAPDSTCTPEEDFQFLPGPIRVFPGSFPVGNRPVRIAAVSMHTADGTVSGAVLVAGVSTVGADAGTPGQPSLKLVDSVNVMDAVQKTATAKKASDVPLDAPPIDVISLDTPATDGGSDFGVNGSAFVLSQAIVVPATDGGPNSTLPAQISLLAVTPAAGGPTAAVVARCALGDVLATRLATPPGRSDLLYVADDTPNPVPGGLGDGVLEIDATAIPPLAAGAPPSCVVKRRLAATNPATGQAQGIIALALSPAWFSADGRTFPSGAFLVGITDQGLAVILRTDTGRTAPLPPFRPLWGGGSAVELAGGATAVELADGGVAPLFDTLPLADGGRYADGGSDTPGDGGPDLSRVLPNFGVPQMEPLQEGTLRDVGFLRTPTVCPDGTPENQPCVLIRVGDSTTGFQSIDFALVAAVTGADGTVLFLDVDKRRFISDIRDATVGSTGAVPTLTSISTLQPAQPTAATPPTIAFPDSPDLLTQGQGLITAGVSRNATWRVIWHAQIPGLERRGGTLSANPDGRLRFDLPGIDLGRWSNLLDVGDVIAFSTFSKPDGSAVCPALAAEGLLSLNREYRISAIGKSYLLLDAQAGGYGADGGAADFTGSDCLPVGATGEGRTAQGFGNKPWLVLQANDVRGRAATGVQQTFSEPRFDYPIEYVFDPTTLGGLPTPDKDIGLSFTISGLDPVLAGSYFTVVVASGQSPTKVVDAQAVNSVGGGFASQVISYTSTKLPGNLIFAAITGSNAVTQIDPQLLGVLGAVITYH